MTCTVFFSSLLNSAPAVFCASLSQQDLAKGIPGYGAEIRNVFDMHIMNLEYQLPDSFVIEGRN